MDRGGPFLLSLLLSKQSDIFMKGTKAEGRKEGREEGRKEELCQEWGK